MQVSSRGCDSAAYPSWMDAKGPSCNGQGNLDEETKRLQQQEQTTQSSKQQKKSQETNKKDNNQKKTSIINNKTTYKEQSQQTGNNSKSNDDSNSNRNNKHQHKDIETMCSSKIVWAGDQHWHKWHKYVVYLGCNESQSGPSKKYYVLKSQCIFLSFNDIARLALFHS